MFTFVLPEWWKEVSNSLRNVYADAIEQARRDACISKRVLSGVVVYHISNNFLKVENQGLPPLSNTIQESTIKRMDFMNKYNKQLFLR